MSRKRKSLDSGLSELKSYAAKRFRRNPVAERKTSAKKSSESKKKSSNKKEKIISSLMDVEEPGMQDEFQLFTAMDIDDNTNTIETENQFHPAVKKLFVSDSDFLEPNLVEATTPERSWETSMAHLGSLPNTSSSQKTTTIHSSENVNRNLSSRITRSAHSFQKKKVFKDNDEFDHYSMKPHCTPSFNILQKPGLILEAERQPKLADSVPVENREVPAMEVVPRVVMKCKNDSMWFTWLSGLFVLYFIGSSFWSINMGSPGKNMSIQTSSNSPFAADTNYFQTNQIDEPNLLLMNNYSIPKVSFAKKSGDSSSSIESTVALEQEKEIEIFPLEEMDPFAFIETTSEEQVTVVDKSVSFDYYSMIDTSSFTFVPTTATSNIFMLQEIEDVALVSKEDEIERISEWQGTKEVKYFPEDQYFGTEISTDDNQADLQPKETMVDNFILPKELSFVSSTDIPTIFPATSNLAVDTAGVRVVAKESTKKCFKAKKWNPFLCHRPLRTINSHKSVTSAADCFAFYLERNDSQKFYKNTMTLTLLQPAKTIYAFGLTHFVADNTNNSSLFNVSCAPKDISFTVFENVPTNTWLISSSMSDAQQPTVKEHETTAEVHKQVTFDSISLKELEKEELTQEEVEKTMPEKAKVNVKKSFQFPWFKKEKQSDDSFQIPTTFDGFFFDPLRQDTTREDYTAGVSVTQIFPLKTAHFPQYVDKVRLQIHSTHGDSDLACVYRVHVYGDA